MGRILWAKSGGTRGSSLCLGQQSIPIATDDNMKSPNQIKPRLILRVISSLLKV